MVASNMSEQKVFCLIAVLQRVQYVVASNISEQKVFCLIAVLHAHMQLKCWFR